MLGHFGGLRLQIMRFEDPQLEISKNQFSNLEMLDLRSPKGSKTRVHGGGAYIYICKYIYIYIYLFTY